MNGIYSTDKFSLHGQNLIALANNRQPFPVHVQMIISDLCSHDCNFCAYRMEGYTTSELFYDLNKEGARRHNPNRMIPLDKALEILDDCSIMGVKAIQFTGGGEPTVHPDHHRIFRTASDLGMDIALVTHGCLLTPEVMRLFVNSGKWIRVSVDASNAATYSNIRRISQRQFDVSMSNLRTLVAMKRTDKDSELVIGFGFVVTKDNWTEVVDAAKLAKSIGVDSFRISALFQSDEDEYFSDFYDHASELCATAQNLSDDTFQVTNSFGARVSDLVHGSPTVDHCGYMNFTTYIGGDLNVYRCCSTAYSTHGKIGSIQDRRFIDLWHSADKMRDFDSFDPHKCTRCQFNKQNEAIAITVKQIQSIQHGNFV